MLISFLPCGNTERVVDNSMTAVAEKSVSKSNFKLVNSLQFYMSLLTRPRPSYTPLLNIEPKPRPNFSLGAYLYSKFETLKNTSIPNSERFKYFDNEEEEQWRRVELKVVMILNEFQAPSS
jgi:hypothetical protein